MSETQSSKPSIKIPIPCLVKSDVPNSDPKLIFELSEVTEIRKGVYTSILNTCQNFFVSNNSANYIQNNKNLVATHSNIREEDLEEGINAYEIEKNKEKSIIKPPIKALSNNIISLNTVGSGDGDYVNVDKSNENNLIARFLKDTRINLETLPKNRDLPTLINNGANSGQKHQLHTEKNFVQNLYICLTQINGKNYKEKDIKLNIEQFILVEENKLKFNIFDDKAKLNNNGNAIIEALHKEYPFVEENIFKSYFESTLISGLSAFNYTADEIEDFINQVKYYIANYLNEVKGGSCPELFAEPVIRNNTISDSFYALHYIQYFFDACMLHYLNESPEIRKSIFTNILDTIKIFEQDPKDFENTVFAKIDGVKSLEDIPKFFTSVICPKPIAEKDYNDIGTTAMTLYNVFGSKNAQMSTSAFHVTQNYLIVEDSENKLFINKENNRIGIGFPAFYEYLTGKVLTKANSTETFDYKLSTKAEILEIEVHVSKLTPQLLLIAPVKTVIYKIDVINEKIKKNFINYLVYKASNDDRKKYTEYIDYFIRPDNVLGKKKQQEIFLMFAKYKFLHACTKNEIENLIKFYGISLIIPYLSRNQLMKLSIKNIIDSVIQNILIGENLSGFIWDLAKQREQNNGDTYKKYVDYFKNPNDELSIPKDAKKEILFKFVEHGFWQVFISNEIDDLLKNWKFCFRDIFKHKQNWCDFLHFEYKIVIKNIDIFSEEDLKKFVLDIIDSQVLFYYFNEAKENGKEYIDFFKNSDNELSIPNKKEIFLKFVKYGFLRVFKPNEINDLIVNLSININEIIPHMTVKQLELNLNENDVIKHINDFTPYQLMQIFNTEDKKNKYLDALKQFREKDDKNNFFQAIINSKCFDKCHFNANDIITWNRYIPPEAFQELSFSSDLYFNSNIISNLISHFGNHEVAPEFLNKISCSLKKLLSLNKKMACTCVGKAFNNNNKEALFGKIVQYKDNIIIFEMFSVTLNSNFKDIIDLRYLNMVRDFLKFLFENRKKNKDFELMIRKDNILIEYLFEYIECPINELIDFYDYEPWHKTDRLAKFPLEHISNLVDFIMDPDKNKNDERKKALARYILKKSFDHAKLMQLPPAVSAETWLKLLMLNDEYKEKFLFIFSNDDSMSKRFVVLNELISMSNKYKDLINNMLSVLSFKTILKNYINFKSNFNLIILFDESVSEDIKNLISETRFEKFLFKELNQYDNKRDNQILIVNFTTNKFVKYIDYVPNNFFTDNIGSQEVKDAMPKISDQKFEEMFSGLNSPTVLPKDLENYFLYLNNRTYGQFDENIKIKLNILYARYSSRINNENEFESFVRDFSKDKTEINLNELPSFMLEKVREKENNIPAQNNIQLNNRPENATPVTPNENNLSESLIIPNVNDEHENDVIMPYEKRDKIYKITGYASIFVSIGLIVLAAIFSLYILIPAAACFLYGGIATSSNSKSNNEKNNAQNTTDQNVNMPNQETPDDNRVPIGKRIEQPTLYQPLLQVQLATQTTSRDPLDAAMPQHDRH